MYPMDVLNELELYALKNYLQNPHPGAATPYITARNPLMFLLMADAGLRTLEMVQISPEMLRASVGPSCALFLPAHTTKTKQPRTIPLSPALFGSINIYLIRLQAETGGQEPVYAFPSNLLNHHISTRTVRRIIRNASYKAINRYIHPHTLRHTFATRLMRTTSMRVVQELLGHKNISSTQIYTHPSDLDLRQAIKNMKNPEPNLFAREQDHEEALFVPEYAPT